MTRRRALLYGILTMMISLSAIAVAAEVLLRFLPVARNPLVVPVTAADPVFHYVPSQSLLFSRDWDFHLVNSGWVNNAGMVNTQDYRKDRSPLLAVVGDSYIEALMVPYAETLQGRLAEALEGRGRVYSFGASGAPLSQYLIWSRYAVREYGAEGLIINVVGNDFDESHDAFKTYFPGFWIYVPGADGQLRLHLYEFHVGATRALVKASALARYLFVNLHLKSVLANMSRFRGTSIGGKHSQGPRYAGNTATDTSAARLKASIGVMDAFFRDLPEYTGLPPGRVLFTLDGFRYPSDSATGSGSYFDRMRRVFHAKAEAQGYEVIDAEPLFLSEFRKKEQRFEDTRDPHWNGTAHGIVAGAVLRSKLLTRFPPSSQE